MSHIAKLGAVLIPFLLGCGGDGSSGPADGGSDALPDAPEFVPGNHVANPAPAPGGGVGEGSIDGETNVFIIDADTYEPIAGADVRIGATAETDPRTGRTDADGLIVFTDPDLTGAQIVTASAADYAAATWFGADGAVITIPLEPTGTPPAVPTATVSGTIPGFEDIALGSGEYLFAAIAYSLLDDQDELVDQGMTPGNACFRVPGLADGPCNWTLTTRTGSLAIYAVLSLANDNGTPFDFTDDSFGFHSYALQTGFDLDEGEILTAQDLPLLDDTDLVTTEVTYGTLPTGLVDVQWLAFLDLGDAGNIILPATPGAPTLDVPGLAGALASAEYRLIAFAQPAPDDDAPQSGILHRTTDVDGTVDLGSWLSMPYALAAVDGLYSFMPSTDATVHAVEFTDSNGGERVWTVLLLNGSTSFELPALDPEPLTGDNDMTVRAFELDGFDPTAFALDGLVDRVERIASDRITFTP